MADETLMELIDAYAEARHVGGCHTYNAKTAEARAKVVASLAASAGSEPVAYRHQHEDGWEYYDAPTGSDCHRCQPLFTHPSPPEGAEAEQALLRVLDVTRRYLPPDGPSAHEAMSEIIAIVDPWPLGPLEKS